MFRIGQKVICVDVSDASHITGAKAPLIAGEIYTVKRTGVTHPRDPDQLPCIEIFEIAIFHRYWAHRFRPLVERKTDISIFKSLLTPSPETVREFAQ